MESRQYWEENGHGVKYESFNSNDDFPSHGNGCSEQLNFATAPSDDEADFQQGYLKKGKVSRQDPMSHRIIEKRRRDRMNNCLADLSRLIPPEYLKKGRGRVEKTEIIEMAIRHLKYLQERANGLYQQAKGKFNNTEAKVATNTECYRAGFQDAVTEVMRFLVEIQGYGPGDGLCVQLTGHLQRHCERVNKGEQTPPALDKGRPTGSSPETSSSTSSSQLHSYAMKQGQALIRAGGTDTQVDSSRYTDSYEDAQYAMECDRVSGNTFTTTEDMDAPSTSGSEPLSLESRGKRESALRGIRKQDHPDDLLHSYKFKNSIQRRFSRSQDSEIQDMSVRAGSGGGGGGGGVGGHIHGRVYTHKRRRASKPPPSVSTSNSGSTEDPRDNSPPDTSSGSPHNHYEKSVAPPPSQFVPVFALNTLGKYYVPLSVDYSCLARHLGHYDMLDPRAAHMAAPLHPVTINVHFQPCINYHHVKPEPAERDWKPM